MSEVLKTPEQVSAAVRELDGLANLLGLPNQERCGILGLTGSAYRLWYSGAMRAEILITAELVRRLGYARKPAPWRAASGRAPCGTSGWPDQAAVSTMRPVTFPSRRRCRAVVASDCGSGVIGKGVMPPFCAKATSSRSSLGLPT